MSASVLTDALGPRGQRRVRIVTWVSSGLLLLLLAVALYRFQQQGQLELRLWKPFLDSEVLGAFWRGTLGTIKAASLSIVAAFAIGLALALGRLSRNVVVRAVVRTWTEFWRGVPVLVLILFVFFGFPNLGINVGSFSALVIALTIYNSAVFAEIFRAGILSLPRGQTEAAYAIGLTYWQAQFNVILPQALRRMLPAAVAQSATVLKDTALGFVISYDELMRQGRTIGEFPPSNMLQSLVVVAAIYVLLVSMLSRLAKRLEVKQRRKLGAGAMHVGGGLEDLEALAEDADAMGDPA